MKKLLHICPTCNGTGKVEVKIQPLKHRSKSVEVPKQSIEKQKSFLERLKESPIVKELHKENLNFEKEILKIDKEITNLLLSYLPKDEIEKILPLINYKIYRFIDHHQRETDLQAKILSSYPISLNQLEDITKGWEKIISQFPPEGIEINFDSRKLMIWLGLSLITEFTKRELNKSIEKFLHHWRSYYCSIREYENMRKAKRNEALWKIYQELSVTKKNKTKKELIELTVSIWKQNNQLDFDYEAILYVWRKNQKSFTSKEKKIFKKYQNAYLAYRSDVFGKESEGVLKEKIEHLVKFIFKRLEPQHYKGDSEYIWKKLKDIEADFEVDFIESVRKIIERYPKIGLKFKLD